METEEKFNDKSKVELTQFSKSNVRNNELKRGVFMSTKEKNTEE